MSAIAGIFNFDGMPVTAEAIGSMTHAMARRGPDGLSQWAEGPVGLGHCMFRTTPESLEETQPLANEDSSIVLVMDGRVDNHDELRKELLQRGAKLRDRSDAELVLRAYEVWRERSPEKIIGDFVFFIWDVRSRRLFGARDAIGNRHFYFYHRSGLFLFASEIKGLIALDMIRLRLNERRLLDYLMPECDDETVETFYQDIRKLPPGHAMFVADSGVTVWRYWKPEDLAQNRFASLDECAEALLDEFRVAVRCRLRSLGPVGATLSGGLDSSSIVALISKEFRDDINARLPTFSLIRSDRENCVDWASIKVMLEDPWLDASVIASDSLGEAAREFLEYLDSADEPFAVDGLDAMVVYAAARDRGCKTLLGGGAGDLLFYGYWRSLDLILTHKRYELLFDLHAAARLHGSSTIKSCRRMAFAFLKHAVPSSVRPIFRRLRNSNFSSDNDLVQAGIAAKHRAFRQAQRHERRDRAPRSDQGFHAQDFLGGLCCYAGEIGEQIALSNGVDPRGPFCDRRLIEFAISMPMEAKLFTGSYKKTLRNSMIGILPEEVRCRRSLSGHPGWQFYRQLFTNTVDIQTDQTRRKLMDASREWVDNGALERLGRSMSFEDKVNLFKLQVLCGWLKRTGVASA